MSISIKLMGVPGPKLMDDEKYTQDMFGVSTPTFVTPDVMANAQLQNESVQNAQIFYFINFHRSHVLDLIMQSLCIKTQSSPFEAPYFSCVPYLLGEGQAMQYSVWPNVDAADADTAPALPAARRLPARRHGRGARRGRRGARHSRCSCRPIRTSCRSRTTPCCGRSAFRRACRWRRCGCRGRQFDSPAQMEFAKRLSYNPWHCIPEHRPLGNQSRARRRMYWELSQLRHKMNDVPHYEPTGDEVFE